MIKKAVRDAAREIHKARQQDFVVCKHEFGQDDKFRGPPREVRHTFAGSWVMMQGFAVYLDKDTWRPVRGACNLRRLKKMLARAKGDFPRPTRYI